MRTDFSELLQQSSTYPGRMCNILAKLALGQFLNSCSTSPPPTPLLEEFSDSVLSKFYVPTDHYTESENSFGADYSSHSGTYKALAPLPNGKEEANAAALAKARVAAKNAMAVLSALPKGSVSLDKFGHSRVHFEH